MKKMKILLCLMLVICMALSMVACGGSDDKKETKDEVSTEPTTESTEPTTESTEDTTEPTSEDETPSDEPIVSSESFEGYYSCVMMFPSASVEEIAQSMLDAVECYDVELSELEKADELVFGYAYYVDATADAMDFTYDYTSTQYLFDTFRDNLYDIMWEALEKEAELYGATWDEMEQACQDEHGTDVDGYINTLLDAIEPNMVPQTLEDQHSTYTAADGIITVDGEEMEYAFDGTELYIYMDGEVLFYMVAE